MIFRVKKNKEKVLSGIVGVVKVVRSASLYVGSYRLAPHSTVGKDRRVTNSGATGA